MKHVLTLLNYKDDGVNNTIRLIYYTAISLIVLSLIFVIIVSIAAPILAVWSIQIATVIIPTCIGIMILIRHKRTPLAGVLLIVLLSLIITASLVYAGGASTPVTNRIITYSFLFILALVLPIVITRNSQPLSNQSNEPPYKSILENIPVTIYINSIGADASTEYISPQVEKLLGYPRDDFINDPLLWTKILHPEDMQKVLRDHRRIPGTDEHFYLEYRVITKDQNVIWVRDEATLVHGIQGEPLYWLGAWTDITSRKEAENEQTNLISVMAKRNIQLQTAAEVSRAASSILNLNDLLPNVVNLIRDHFDYYYVGIFLVEESREWANLAAATGEMGALMLQNGHRLKVEESSMIGWCIRHREARIALDVGEDAVRFVNPYLLLTRSEIALPLIAHGEVIGAMTIQSDRPAAFSHLDIMALQTMADQIANAIENARLFTERVDLIRELESQNAELERFTYTVSHDLRSPLVTIRGFLGYLKQDATSGDTNRFDKDLKRIANAVDRMQTLLNELLELSRIGRIVSPLENVLFEDIIKDAKEILAGPLEAGNVKLELVGEFPYVHVDRLRLTEVIQNLLSNAIKFARDQKQPVIRIGTKGVDEEDKPVFYIQDNGIGIDPRYHERIFGLFNRLNPEIEGTGIGLALVRRIIETHGGHIWVEF